VATGEQLIQALKVLDVSGKMIQKHNVKENPHDLRQGRIFLIGGFFLMFEIFAADTDRQNPLRTQAYDRAERLLKAHTAIPEKGRSLGCFESHRLKH